MNKRILVIVVAILLTTPFAHADVESSLMGLRMVLLGSILPFIVGASTML